MISLIAAVADNKVIGSHNDLPWYLPEDLKHFKELTTGHTVLMGKNTFESILKRIGKPLPNRKNVVLTRDKNFQTPEGVVVYHDLTDALAALANDGEIMVAGGAQIFQQTIELADKLYITEVHQQASGDVLFPDIDHRFWKETARQDHEEFSFVTYERIT
jgi:dihydrofolate reductase